MHVRTYRSTLAICRSDNHFIPSIQSTNSPRMKLQMQKKPCIGYNLHSIASCRYGVISPTRKLNAQFVAVERETPFARTVKGMIYTAIRQYTEPKTTQGTDLGRVEPRDRSPAVAKGSIEDDYACNDGSWCLGHVNVHPPSGEAKRYGHLIPGMSDSADVYQWFQHTITAPLRRITRRPQRSTRIHLRE